MHKKNNYVSVSKEVYKKNFATGKSLCNLQELYTAFKENQPNINTEFSKHRTFRPKWCVLASSKMTHSVCVCSADQNIVLLVDALDWLVTYKDMIKLALPCLFSMKIYLRSFYITIIHKCIFYNWNITNSPYLQVHLIIAIKSLLIFLGDRNVRCCFL